VVYAAPLLLGEVALDAALVSRSIAACAAATRSTGRAVARRTALPALRRRSVALAGLAPDIAAPQADSIGGVPAPRARSSRARDALVCWARPPHAAAARTGRPMGILYMILLGLVIGALAKWIFPGPGPGGIVMTIVIGIAGAVLAAHGRRLGRWPTSPCRALRRRRRCCCSSRTVARRPRELRRAPGPCCLDWRIALQGSGRSPS
jgi:hypothetical protein